MKNLSRLFFIGFFILLNNVSLFAETNECIHIPDVGVKTVVNNAVHRYHPNIGVSAQQNIVDKALDAFYKKYNISDALICVDTVSDICKEVIPVNVGNFETECKKIRSDIADAMRFEPVCMTGKNSGYCNKSFSGVGIFSLYEAKGLIEFFVKVSETGKAVYCSNDLRDDEENSYISCKVTDGEKFQNYEYAFSDVKMGVTVSQKNRARVAEKAANIAWPNAEIQIVSMNVFDVFRDHGVTMDDVLKFKDEDDNEGRFRPSKNLLKTVQSDDFKDSAQEEVYAYVNGISKQECEKYDKIIKEIFGGYARYEESKNICVTTWYPSFEKDNSVNRDFDKAGFGTDYMFFINEPDARNLYSGKTYNERIISYLKIQSEKVGKELTNIHCDATPGLYKDSKRAKEIYNDTYKKSMKEDEEKTSLLTDFIFSRVGGKYSFIRCYGTYKNKVLTEDFMFHEKESIFGK